jgi:uncharacterized protein
LLKFDYVRPHRKTYKCCARIVFMPYTEIKERNGKKYYYRVRSVREGKKVKKKRIYLGRDLNKKRLNEMENIGDGKLGDMKNVENLEKLKLGILKVLKKYKIKKAGIFGSYARGEQKRNSDIDILVEPPEGIGFGFAGIGIELEEKLGKKVDLVSYNGLNPYFREDVLKQEVRII